MQRYRNHLVRGRALTLAALITMAGASGPTFHSANAAGSTLAIGEINPFTGPSAADGGEMTAGCLPATRLVNQAGGILGHPVQCVEADTKGDPVDAVPAVRQLLATQSNLVGVLGPGSGEAASTVPLLNQAKMTMFAMPGQSNYDQNTYQYFWRILPPDDAEGYAMAVWAHQKGITRAASVFANNVAAQTNVPTLLRGAKALGITVTINQSIAQDQTSYRSEIEQMLATKPQVIFTEADPQTSSTYLAELTQLHGMIPIIGSPVTIEGPWLQAVSKVVGKQSLNRYWTGVEPFAAQAGPAWQVFDKALLDKATGVPSAKDFTGDPWSLSEYDSVNIMGLAMTLSKSTVPATYNGSIMAVTARGSAKTKVYSYAQGQAALKAGKQIQYIGAFGQILFNKYHNSLGAFEAVNYANGSLPQIGTISAAALAAVNR